MRTARFPLKMLAVLLGLALISTPSATAQLPGGLLDGPIGRGIDDTIDRTVDRTLTDSLNDRVQRAAERLVQVKDIPKAILDPLLDTPLLPARKEVPVENNWRLWIMSGLRC